MLRKKGLLLVLLCGAVFLFDSIFPNYYSCNPPDLVMRFPRVIWRKD